MQHYTSYAIFLFRYNVSSKEWLEEDRLFHPSPRYFHAVAASSNMNTIFIHGGVVDDLTTSNELWEFSPSRPLYTFFVVLPGIFVCGV